MASQINYTCDACKAKSDNKKAEWIELWANPDIYEVSNRADLKYPHSQMHACSLSCLQKIVDNIERKA